MKFRVAGVTEAGTGRVNVSLVTEAAPVQTGIPYGQGHSTVNLNLTTEEATDYFPGKFFEVSISPADA